MTSSIYPILESLSTPIITAPGSGYITTPTVTIDPPSSGTTATGIAVVANGVINAISAIGGANSGYTDGEEITLSGGDGTSATATAVISGNSVSSISFTSRGFDFTATNTITITGNTSSSANATFDVDSIANNAVSSITLTNGGTGYTSLPTITITGGGGTGATATAVLKVKSAVASVNTNIFSSDIIITNDHVSPGGGGILRLMFSFDFANSTAALSVFNNGSLKGTLNADNDGDIILDGYYRFDLDVESGDSINLQADEIINGVNFVRAHLVQFGA